MCLGVFQYKCQKCKDRRYAVLLQRCLHDAASIFLKAYEAIYTYPPGLRDHLHVLSSEVYGEILCMRVTRPESVFVQIAKQCRTSPENFHGKPRKLKELGMEDTSLGICLDCSKNDRSNRGLTDSNASNNDNVMNDWWNQINKVATETRKPDEQMVAKTTEDRDALSVKLREEKQKTKDWEQKYTKAKSAAKRVAEDNLKKWREELDKKQEDLDSKSAEITKKETELGELRKKNSRHLENQQAELESRDRELFRREQKLVEGEAVCKTNMAGIEKTKGKLIKEMEGWRTWMKEKEADLVEELRRSNNEKLERFKQDLEAGLRGKDFILRRTEMEILKAELTVAITSSLEAEFKRRCDDRAKII